MADFNDRRDPEPTHKIRWYVYGVPGDRSTMMPRQASMRGTWAYDAKCSCGTETRTGGATEGHIRELIWLHKFGSNQGWHTQEAE